MMTGSQAIRRSVPGGIALGATSRFLSQYTVVQQTLMVARVAMWNLQWQVKGFMGAQPGVSSRTLLGRFVDGSGVEGLDLKASVAKASWESMDQQTCRLLLINTVALYENWCHEITDTFIKFGTVAAHKKRDYEGFLQTPGTIGATSPDGIHSLVSLLISAAGSSPGMATLAARVNPPDAATMGCHVERMIIYRMFKEARNAIAHQGGLANDKLVNVYNACQGISADDLKMRVVPEFHVPKLGVDVMLSWRGIIGLADMLRRTVVDIDHSLMPTKVAEKDLVERLLTDPGALSDPSLAGGVIKNDKWAKLPGGPWIVSRNHPKGGQGAVRFAVQNLTRIGFIQENEFLYLWPELVNSGVVEIRPNLQGI